MFLIYRIRHYLLRTAYIVFTCQLVMAGAYAQDDYIEALAKAAGEEYTRSDAHNNRSLAVNVDDADRAEFESQLFKTSSQYYQSFLDLEGREKSLIIAAYKTNNSMESAIDKLLELSGSM